MPRLGKYEAAFAGLHKEKIPYYRAWSHDRPMLISHQRDAELRALQRVLYKCAAYYVRHYEEYLDLLPYEEKVLEILAFVKPYPFRAGTFRPDFLIGEDGSLKLCEITSRFFGNGYFLSFFLEYAGRDMAEKAGVTDSTSYFEAMLSGLAAMLSGHQKICVLRSHEKSDSVGLYLPFYEALGASPRVLPAEAVEDALPVLEGSAVFSALNQRDLLSYRMDSLRRIADCGVRNDFRTVFLLHDKRFFYLFHQDRFTGKCLSPEEAAFLRDHVVRTYIYGRDGAVWEDAREKKDGYILKHHCLGKSEKVFAGCLCTAEEWEGLFRQDEIREMILQPFVRQRLFPVVWHGQPLRDYACGTMLCVDEQYYGCGLFRTSTRPVINQADAHKIAPVITDEAGRFQECHIL